MRVQPLVRRTAAPAARSSLALHVHRAGAMRAAVLGLIFASAAWPQFRSTVPLVVAPTTITDSRGRVVDSVDPADLLLYDNNVLRPIQADYALFPISLVVAVESSQSSKAVLDKLGNTGILFAQLLAAEQGETALLSFSDTVTSRVSFTSDPDDLAHELKRIKPDGNGAAVLDGLAKALDLLSHRSSRRRLIVLMISESRDRSSGAKLPEVAAQVQHLNAAVYWLTYSTTWTQYTDRKITTYGDTEDPKLKGIDKQHDETIAPTDGPQYNLLAPFTELAHLTRPNLADLFTRLTGGSETGFLTKGALESSIHAIGEEIHRQYILTFPPAAGQAGLFHTVRVEVRNRPDLKIKTRAGYWSVE